MLRKWMLGCAGIATAAGILIATSETAWARRSRCCCGGGYYAGYGYSGAYPLTYSGGMTGSAYEAPYSYGTYYGPQGAYSGGYAGQGYYDSAGQWHAYGPAGANVQGGVDAGGRAIIPNQNGARANTGAVDSGSIQGNGAARNNGNAGRVDANGNARSSTRGTAPSSPPPPNPAPEQ
ncbi:MAG: hypothetical protein ACM3U2_03775 [Deltaproteobacteria bacterium]